MSAQSSSTPAFAAGFNAVYEQHSERDGQPFEVLGVVDPSSYDSAQCGTLYRIRFHDGVEIQAWPEEVEQQEQS